MKIPVVSSKEAGKALKTISQRLKEFDFKSIEEIPNSHTCGNCKYRVGEEGYDQQWGMTYCVHNWCEKGLMDSWDKKKPDYWIVEGCSEYEEGEGKYIRMPDKERKRLGV